MTGLMMMFLLVAVLFMVNVDAEKAKVEELMHETERQANRMKGIARLYDEMREQLYRDLAQRVSLGFASMEGRIGSRPHDQV